MRKGWVETKATVATVGERDPEGGFGHSVVFTYKVDGHFHGGTFNTLKRYQPGDSLSVHYDPNDPDKNNYARRGEVLRWAYIACSVFFGALAIYELIQRNTK